MRNSRFWSNRVSGVLREAVGLEIVFLSAWLDVEIKWCLTDEQSRSHQ